MLVCYIRFLSSNGIFLSWYRIFMLHGFLKKKINFAVFSVLSVLKCVHFSVVNISEVTFEYPLISRLSIDVQFKSNIYNDSSFDYRIFIYIVIIMVLLSLFVFNIFTLHIGRNTLWHNFRLMGLCFVLRLFLCDR
jgi:hypothetical protein